MAWTQWTAHWWACPVLILQYCQSRLLSCSHNSSMSDVMLWLSTCEPDLVYSPWHCDGLPNNSSFCSGQSSLQMLQESKFMYCNILAILVHPMLHLTLPPKKPNHLVRISQLGKWQYQYQHLPTKLLST
jgi:hypothetical protein